jgi:hypothetical protein
MLYFHFLALSLLLPVMMMKVPNHVDCRPNVCSDLMTNDINDDDDDDDDHGSSQASQTELSPHGGAWLQPPPSQKPLTSYVIFFQLERKRIIQDAIDDDRPYTHTDIINTIEERLQPKPRRKHRKTHGKASFKDMAKIISSKWRKLDYETKKLFQSYASQYNATYFPSKDILREQDFVGTNDTNRDMVPMGTTSTTTTTTTRTVSPAALRRNAKNDDRMMDTKIEHYQNIQIPEIEEDQKLRSTNQWSNNTGSIHENKQFVPNEKNECNDDDDDDEDDISLTKHIQLIRWRIRCREAILQYMKKQNLHPFLFQSMYHSAAKRHHRYVLPSSEDTMSWDNHHRTFPHMVDSPWNTTNSSDLFNQMTSDNAYDTINFVSMDSSPHRDSYNESSFYSQTTDHIDDSI